MAKASARKKEVKCGVCVDAVMVYHPPTKPGGKDRFWKCPECGAETWPYNASIEKQIRKAMATLKPRGKKSGSRKSGRFRQQKKPGEKFEPWWK